MALLILSVFSSCRMIRPSLMLKTPKGFTYDQVNDSMTVDDYRISANDALQLRLLSNDGFKLVDISNITNPSGLTTFDVIVEQDGTVKLPIVGRIKLDGMSVREAEQLLETHYGEFYRGPFVTIRVTNKRVAVFQGAGGGLGQVIPLSNNQTTLFEALALAGGISEDGKAYKIKLIRRATPKPKVYLIDLSTIDGLKDGNLVVQANDVIYVESRDRIVRRLTTEVVPYISLITSFLLVYSLLKR